MFLRYHVNNASIYDIIDKVLYSSKCINISNERNRCSDVDWFIISWRFIISEISFNGSEKLRTIKIDAKFTELSLGIACAREPT